MSHRDAKELLIKYRDGFPTAEEKAMLDSWYLQWKEEEAFELSELDYQKAEAAILRKLPASPRPALKGFPLWPRTIAAAAVLILISFGGYFLLRKDPIRPVNTIARNDIPPGGNKATLVLSDGSVVVLDNAKNGRLASQGNISIQKSGDGLLTYRAIQSATGQPGNTSTYNTISTPRGGQYHIILSDGSEVWLNAASSLKFPPAFKGTERNVELIGEAYFEIAKNPAMPFHVKSTGQTIEVLGTHFNINAYKDEPSVKTTLLEGSVKVTKGPEVVLLKPGQQSVLMQEGPDQIRISDDIDMQEILAWKNGMFQFNEADIKTIMRQVSRWYNVDVEFEGKISSDHFKGKVPRDVNVSQVLRILELSGVNFKIEGKKIIVK